MDFLPKNFFGPMFSSKIWFNKKLLLAAFLSIDLSIIYSGDSIGYLSYRTLKAATHEQVNLTSMLDQVTCSSKFARLYGETWLSIRLNWISVFINSVFEFNIF